MPECPCGAPLGADSIESGWTLCHTCRKCPRCNQPVRLEEATYCQDNGLPILHARCMVVDDSLLRRVKESPVRFVDLINMVHLLSQDTTLIGNGIADLSFDQKFLFLQNLQRIAAETSVLIRKDKALYDKEQLRAAAPVAHAKKREREVEAQVAALPSQKAKKTKLDKFCEAMAGLGISRSDAERLFQEQQGKVQ